MFSHTGLLPFLLRFILVGKDHALGRLSLVNQLSWAPLPPWDPAKQVLSALLNDKILIDERVGLSHSL